MEREQLEEQMAWKVGPEHYLVLQTCEDGWDYTLYDKELKEIDGGQLDMPELSMEEARKEILMDFALDESNLVVTDYEEIMEQAEKVEEERLLEKVADLKEERYSVLQKLNNLKMDTGEHPRLRDKTKGEER